MQPLAEEKLSKLLPIIWDILKITGLSNSYHGHPYLSYSGPLILKHCAPLREQLHVSEVNNTYIWHLINELEEVADSSIKSCEFSPRISTHKGFLPTDVVFDKLTLLLKCVNLTISTYQFTIKSNPELARVINNSINLFCVDFPDIFYDVSIALNTISQCTEKSSDLNDPLIML